MPFGQKFGGSSLDTLNPSWQGEYWTCMSSSIAKLREARRPSNYRSALINIKPSTHTHSLVFVLHGAFHAEMAEDPGRIDPIYV